MPLQIETQPFQFNSPVLGLSSAVFNSVSAVSLSGVHYGDGSNLTGISTYNGSDVKALTGNWQSTYSTVSSLSANWNTAYLTLSTNPHILNQSLSSTTTLIGSNTASNTFSEVLGGQCNIASGVYSTLVNGFSSCATGYATFVGAGSGIKATGNYAVAVGGRCNTVSGAYSSIINGICNTASASNSLIGQGRFNFTNQYNSNIGGGLYNNIGGCAPLYTNISNVSGNGTCSLISNTLNTCYGLTTNGDTIGIVWTTASNPLSSACFTTGTIVCAGASGSPYNTIISGDYSKCTASSLSAVCMFVFDRSVCSGAFCGSFVGGGSLNTASGNYNTVVGGQCNFASCGVHNTIGGGWASCILNGSCNTISGGKNNIINAANTGNSNTISGGYSNLIQAGTYNFIGGGNGNCHTCKSYMAVIGGGRSNTASGCYSSILGGAFNCACCSAGCSVVGGGCKNTVTSNYASVFGGTCNTASGTYSFVAGGCCNNDFGNTNSFLLGSGLSANQPNFTYVNNLNINNNAIVNSCVAASNYTSLSTLPPSLSLTQTVSSSTGAGITMLSANYINLNPAALNDSAVLMNLTNNGTSRFSVDSKGLTTIVGTFGNARGFRVSSNDGQTASFNVTFNGTTVNGPFNFTSTSNGSPDTIIVRDGKANTVALQNSTFSNTFRSYNTYTNAQNYERGSLTFSTPTSALTIAAEASGTGLNRDIWFNTANATRMAITSGGNVGIGTTTPSSTLTVVGSISATGTVAANPLAVANSQTATVGVGTISGKFQIFDANGNSLGFVPIYTTIT